MKEEKNKALNIIESKENERAENLKKSEEEIKKINAKLAVLDAKIESAEDAEQYRAILNEKRDNEAALLFFKKKIENIKKRHVITAEEYTEIKSNIKGDFSEIQKETREKIETIVNDLFSIMFDYETKTNELNKMLMRAGKLANNTPQLLNPRTIRGIDFNRNNYFYDAYFETMRYYGMFPGAKGNPKKEVNKHG